MAATQSKRKRRIEARHKKEASSVIRVVAIVTAILLVLLYFVFKNA